MKNSASVLLYLSAFLIVICAAVGALAWTAVYSPAMSLGAEPVLPQSRGFGYAQIPKPTYTFTPTTTPTSTPTQTPAPTQIAQVEILQDTPTPEYAEYYDAPNYGGSKYILVDISEQHMYVYEGDSLIYSFVASTGMNNGTRVGTFSVLEKIPNAYGSTWNIWMPHWLGIYWSGSLQNGIHALPILPNGGTLWAGYLGTPISYGCVVLDTYEANLLYDWADVGTPVEIQR